MIKKYGVSVCPSTDHLLDYISTWYTFQYLKEVDGKYYYSFPPPPYQEDNPESVEEGEVQSTVEKLIEHACKVCSILSKEGLIYNCVYEFNHRYLYNAIQHGICRFVPRIEGYSEEYTLNQFFFFLLNFSGEESEKANRYSLDVNSKVWKMSFGEHKFPPLFLRIANMDRSKLIRSIPEELYDLEVSPNLYSTFYFNIGDTDLEEKLIPTIKKWKRGLGILQKYLRPKYTPEPY